MIVEVTIINPDQYIILRYLQYFRVFIFIKPSQISRIKEDTQCL